MSNEKQPVTWRHVKDIVNQLTDEQLSQEVRIWGDERGEKCVSVTPLSEDYCSDDCGYQPKSVFESEDDYDNEVPAGTPIIYID